MSSNVFPFARCDSQELAANNIIYIYMSRRTRCLAMKLHPFDFFSSSYVTGVTHTSTLSIRHSCRKIHTYIRIYFRTIQFRRASSLKLHLLQRSIDKTRQLYFSIRRLPNFYEATVPLVQVSSNLCGEPVTRYSRERKVSISVPCRKMRGKDRELEVGDERRQCSSFGSRRGGGWPACTVLAREHKGQRMSWT